MELIKMELVTFLDNELFMGYQPPETLPLQIEGNIPCYVSNKVFVGFVMVLFGSLFTIFHPIVLLIPFSGLIIMFYNLSKVRKVKITIEKDNVEFIKGSLFRQKYKWTEPRVNFDRLSWRQYVAERSPAYELVLHNIDPKKSIPLQISLHDTGDYRESFKEYADAFARILCLPLEENTQISKIKNKWTDREEEKVRKEKLFSSIDGERENEPFPLKENGENRKELEVELDDLPASSEQGNKWGDPSSEPPGESRFMGVSFREQRGSFEVRIRFWASSITLSGCLVLLVIVAAGIALYINFPSGLPFIADLNYAAEGIVAIGAVVVMYLKEESFTVTDEEIFYFNGVRLVEIGTKKNYPIEKIKNVVFSSESKTVRIELEDETNSIFLNVPDTAYRYIKHCLEYSFVKTKLLG